MTDLVMEKRIEELDSLVGGSDYQRGLSSSFGNGGDWCTLTVECMPSCN